MRNNKKQGGFNGKQKRIHRVLKEEEVYAGDKLSLRHLN